VHTQKTVCVGSDAALVASVVAVGPHACLYQLMSWCLPMQRPDGTFDSVPDPGLDEQYEYIRLLGYGGTGQTLLYRNRRTDELAAIKLIKRPLPEIIQQRLLREFTVCTVFSWKRTARHPVRL